METIPTELKRAILDNNLLLFVGAGCSYELTNIAEEPLKGWSHLVTKLLASLEIKGHDVSHLEPLITKFDPIDVLHLIERSADIPNNAIYPFIKDFFDVETDNNFELHKKLFQLSPKIITTNYDNAFEQAVPELRKNKAYKGRNYELTKIKEPNSPLLFKLHGCLEDADSTVLFPTDYNNLYENKEKDAEHPLLVLKNIIMNKTILFIGTGMGDFQINSIFKEIEKLQGQHNQKHFIITNKTLDSSLSFLTPLKVKEYAEIAPLIESLVKIKKESDTNEPSETKELRKQLEEANRRIAELEHNSHKDKLLEREALKYFGKGVKFSLVNNSKEACEQYKTAIELKSDLHDALNNWGADLGNLAKTKEGAEKEELYKEAFEKYEKALEIKSDYHEALYNWGTVLGNLAETKEGSEKEELYREAFEKYEKALEIKSDYHDALYNWGNGLGNLAETKEGSEKEELYKEAFEKYEKALEIKSDSHEAFNNWGIGLGNLAETKEGAEKEELYKEAFEKYEKALEIKSDKHEVLNNWGISLGNLAKTKEGSEKEELYKEAFEKYEKALEIKSDYHEAFNNWGTGLGNLAKTKEGAEKEELYKEAFEKYEKALEIKPDYHEALYNWGTDLGNLAKTKEGSEKEELFREAIDKLKTAVKYGESSYNLACILALKGDKKEALENLEISLSKNEIDVDFVEKGENWVAYFEDKEFIELLNKYRK